MCIQIYTLHEGCQHRSYQNTFACQSARGVPPGHPTRGRTLTETVHLPARRTSPLNSPRKQQPRGFTGYIGDHARMRQDNQPHKTPNTASKSIFPKCNEALKKATRPVEGCCPSCRKKTRQQRERLAAMAKDEETDVATLHGGPGSQEEQSVVAGSPDKLLGDGRRDEQLERRKSLGAVRRQVNKLLMRRDNRISDEAC